MQWHWQRVHGERGASWWLDLRLTAEYDATPQPTSHSLYCGQGNTAQHHFLLGSTTRSFVHGGGFYLHYFVMPSCKCSFSSCFHPLSLCSHVLDMTFRTHSERQTFRLETCSYADSRLALLQYGCSGMNAICQVRSVKQTLGPDTLGNAITVFMATVTRTDC